MNLLDLNEYCLIKIIKHLDLNTQITLQQVCSQLQRIIHYLWQHSYKVLTIDGFQIKTNLYKNDAQFVKVLTHISSFIYELKVQHFEARKLRLLRNVHFENCRKLTLSDWHQEIQDADIKMISKMLPHLEIFLPKCIRITGAYLERYKYLTHLDLSNCTALKSKYLPAIFHEIKLKFFKMRFNSNSYIYQQLRQNAQYEQTICSSILSCPTLQTLELDDYQLAMLTANMQLKQLPQLTNVKCYVRDYMSHILRDLENYYALEIFEFIALDDNVTLQLLTCLSRGSFLHLMKLTLVNSYLMDLPIVLAKNLQELHLVGCNLEQALLLSCISNFKCLQLLNVTKCKGLKAQFLWELLPMLRQDVEVRNCLPLKIIIRDSSLEESLLNHPDILRSADVLILSWETLSLDLDINHFEFTLKHKGSA